MEYLDMYGQTPYLLLNRKKKLGSGIGICASFLTLAATICSLWFFGKDLIYRKKPSLFTSTFNFEDPAPFKLTRNNFNLAVRVVVPEATDTPLNEYYSAIAKLYLFTNDPETGSGYENKTLKLTSCSKMDFKLLPERFGKISPEYSFCLDEDEIMLQGAYGQPVFATVGVEIRKCEGRPECKSQEEIDEAFKARYFSVFLADYSFDPSSYEKPSEPFVKNMYTSIDPNVQKDFITDIAVSEIVSDIGYIFESEEETFSYRIEDNQTFVNSSSSNLMLQYSVRLSTKKYRYQRSYLKIQKIAANTGGIIKIIYFMGKAATFWFNNLFYFDALNRFVFPPNSKRSVLNTAGKPNVSLDKLKMSELTKVKVTKDKSLSSLDLLKLLCCKRSLKIKKLLAQKKKFVLFVNSKIDVMTLIKQQNEWKVAKEMLLNEHQNTLLTYCNAIDSYSSIEEDSYKKQRLFDSAERTVKQKLEESFKYCSESINIRDKTLMKGLGLN